MGTVNPVSNIGNWGTLTLGLASISNKQGPEWERSFYQAPLENNEKEVPALQLFIFRSFCRRMGKKGRPSAEIPCGIYCPDLGDRISDAG